MEVVVVVVGMAGEVRGEATAGVAKVAVRGVAGREEATVAVGEGAVMAGAEMVAETEEAERVVERVEEVRAVVREEEARVEVARVEEVRAVVAMVAEAMVAEAMAVVARVVGVLEVARAVVVRVREAAAMVEGESMGVVVRVVA